MTQRSNILTADMFEGALKYDESSPSCLTWDTTIRVGFNLNRASVVPGQYVTSVNCATGYYQVRFKRVSYRAHRVVFALVNGTCPDGLIDHIDGNKLNNQIDNLRVVDTSLSNKNRLHKNNTGLPFTHFSQKQNRFQVQFTINGVRTCKTFNISEYGSKEIAFIAAKSFLLESCDKLKLSDYSDRCIEDILVKVKE